MAVKKVKAGVKQNVEPADSGSGGASVADWTLGSADPSVTNPEDGPSEMDYRAYRKVLRMVTELHVRGFQRLRIAPGMAASGCYWRCSITPVTNISNRHGARMLSWDTLVARYSSADKRQYFGWNDAAHLTPSRLANLFIERFPRIAEAGRGSDWVYAGWYLEMLGLTYPRSFPIAYADWHLPVDYLATVGQRSDIRIPLPPPGWGPEERIGAE